MFITRSSYNESSFLLMNCILKIWLNDFYLWHFHIKISPCYVPTYYHKVAPAVINRSEWMEKVMSTAVLLSRSLNIWVAGDEVWVRWVRIGDIEMDPGLMNIITAFIETRSWELLEGKRNKKHSWHWMRLIICHEFVFILGPCFFFGFWFPLLTDQEIFQAYVKVSYSRSANSEG